MGYIERFLKQRKNLFVTIDFHTACRVKERRADEEEITETVRTGKVNLRKSKEISGKPYNKICLCRYFGKANKTLEVVLLHDEEFAQGEVKTVWECRGRKTFREKS